MEMNMWIYDNKEFTEEMISEYVGFVYEITNLNNGRKYVGKKSFTKSKTYQKNKRKKRKRVSSDWIAYTGSNEQLNEDIGLGHQVSKKILHLCKSKGWMTYLETKEILVRDCIISDEYYNVWVSAKIRRSHLK
jgi:hypothetical protein